MHFILEVSRYTKIAYIGVYLALIWIERLFSTVWYFLSYFCWSVKYMSRPSKFPQIFYNMQKTEAKFLFEGFYYWNFWKVQFQLSNSFLGFFIWSVNCSTYIFSHFLLIIKLLELSLWFRKFDLYCFYLFRFFSGL